VRGEKARVTRKKFPPPSYNGGGGETHRVDSKYSGIFRALITQSGKGGEADTVFISPKEESGECKRRKEKIWKGKKRMDKRREEGQDKEGCEEEGQRRRYKQKG